MLKTASPHARPCPPAPDLARAVTAAQPCPGWNLSPVLADIVGDWELWVRLAQTTDHGQRATILRALHRSVLAAGVAPAHALVLGLIAQDEAIRARRSPGPPDHLILPAELPPGQHAGLGRVLALLRRGRPVHKICDITTWPRAHVLAVAAAAGLVLDNDTDIARQANTEGLGELGVGDTPEMDSGSTGRRAVSPGGEGAVARTNNPSDQRRVGVCERPNSV